MAYFASTRSSKQGQLDVYKVLVKSVPLNITLIKGTFINQVDPTKRLAKITTIDATTNKEVDVQYTDPTTGEYVLSFPKGGKYKFLVEEKSSNKIHAGLVDVPTSSGVKAFLQEMELISSMGVEKLLINNLFDQTYDGDVMALAQKMLRQRAALDVNFDPDDIPAIQDTESVEKVPALAFSDAGFGAGMTNEKILEEAEARVEELKDRQILTAQLTEGAARRADEYFASANENSGKAESQISKAQEDGNEERGLAMYEAGFAKLLAQDNLRKATNAKNLKEGLFEKSSEAKAAYEVEKARVDSLREAIDSNDYDAIYAGLVAEREKRESIDKVEDRFEPVQEIRRRGLKADAEAQKLLERAQKVRDQEEQLNASLTTKRTQSTKMKGKDLKRVEEEIAVLETDIESAQRKTKRAFKQAEDAQMLADNEIQEFEILQNIAETNDPASIPSETEPALSWSDPEQKLLAEGLRDLPIDDAAIAAYTDQHPEVFEEMGSEAMAMNFRRTYGNAAGSEDIALNKSADELTASDDEEGLTDQSEAEEEIALSESQLDEKSSENDKERESQLVESADANGSSGTDEAAVAETLTVDETPSKANKEKDSQSAESRDVDAAAETGVAAIAETLAGIDSQEETDPESVATEYEYDESLPVEKRIEAEEIKIQAAEDWVAIIDESIAQLESGAGGEEGAEEQLAEYRKLRSQKAGEIEERQELVSTWSEEAATAPTAQAIGRARADVDSLSPSLVARLESKIPDYSTEISSIKSVSAIDRSYLPELAEIEISGLSAPELAKKRIELNERFIADIDQILNEGIVSDVSQEDLVVMRRVKMLEVMQDEQVMEGKADYMPRSAEAQSYAELIKEDVQEETPVPVDNESTYTELSPAVAKSLESPYSKESVLPDYTALIEEAELTTNTDVAQAQKIKVKEDFLIQLQSEISIYKAAIDVAESPDPELVARYGTLLRERSSMIDEVNIDKVALETGDAAPIAEVVRVESADSLIAALSVQTKRIDGQSDQTPSIVEIDKAKVAVAEKIDAYVAILDNPKVKVDRNEVQVEIQKLQRFQEELNEAADASELLTQDESSQELIAENSSEPNDLGDNQPTNAKEEGSDDSVAPDVEITEAIPVEEDTEQERNSNEALTETAENLELDENELTADQQNEFEEILSISEGFVIDFDQKSSAVVDNSSADERALKALADLNGSFVVSIENKIDSLETLQGGGGEDFQKVLADEIAELQALSADKQQESDRLLAEAELLAIPQPDETFDVKTSDELATLDVDDVLPEMVIPDLSSIQYKSLNASIIRNGLKSKSDSLIRLKSDYNDIKTDVQREAAMAEMERINAELNEGLTESNFAEIEYYQNENKRILSQLDPNKSKNREEIIALQAKSTQLEAKVPATELSQDLSGQMSLIAELSEVNKSLSAFSQPADEMGNSAILDDVTTALLKAESHVTVTNKSYLTNLQAITLDKMPSQQRAALIERDEKLQTKLDFSESTSMDEKKALVASATKVDKIGLDLLSETPDQLNYLVAMVSADSLKRLEQSRAAYAELKQSQAIELSSEADRLLKMLPNQENDRDRESVKARAKKLEQEAEVMYETSAIAADQAEAIRAKRSENDQELIVLSTELSFKQRRALDNLLLKPGYRIIPSEEVAEVADELVAEAPDVVAPLEEDTPPVASEPVIAENKPVKPEVSESTGLAAVKGNWLGMVEIIAEKEDFSDVEESMFVEAETSVYDASKTIPLDPVMPTGLIFQVQVGAYRNPIPQDLFGPYAPIMGQKLDNGITRYRAGLFKKYGEAIQARNEIRTKGYSDAFVVVYVDGEKLTGEQARDILAQAKEKEAVNVELVSGIPTDQPLAENSEPIKESTTTAPNTEYYNDPEAAEAAQVEVITGLFYTVQVGVYSKPVKLDQLYNLAELNSELTGSGVIRYTTGRFGDLTKARSRKDLAVERGVTDAFITAYYNGKRISLAEAQEILNTKGAGALATQVGDSNDNTPTSEKAADETYVVIMGTFTDDVPSELADLFLENKSWGIRKIEGPGNGAIYLSQDMPSLADAKKLLEECKALNIKSAAIGIMKGGKITSVQND
jgi:hypothetical protein